VRVDQSKDVIVIDQAFRINQNTVNPGPIAPIFSFGASSSLSVDLDTRYRIANYLVVISRPAAIIVVVDVYDIAIGGSVF
jgi:hypothetical protein